MSSRIVRIASGSPQPGHSECSVESSRSDFAETFFSGGVGGHAAAFRVVHVGDATR